MSLLIPEVVKGPANRLPSVSPQHVVSLFNLYCVSCNNNIASPYKYVITVPPAAKKWVSHCEWHRAYITIDNTSFGWVILQGSLRWFSILPAFIEGTWYDTSKVMVGVIEKGGIAYPKTNAAAVEFPIKITYHNFFHTSGRQNPAWSWQRFSLLVQCSISPNQIQTNPKLLVGLYELQKDVVLFWHLAYSFTISDLKILSGRVTRSLLPRESGSWGPIRWVESGWRRVSLGNLISSHLCFCHH